MRVQDLQHVYRNTHLLSPIMMMCTSCSLRPLCYTLYARISFQISIYYAWPLSLFLLDPFVICGRKGSRHILLSRPFFALHSRYTYVYFSSLIISRLCKCVGCHQKTQALSICHFHQTPPTFHYLQVFSLSSIFVVTTLFILLSPVHSFFTWRVGIQIWKYCACCY